MTADPDFQPSVPLSTDTIPLRERLVVGASGERVFCQDGTVFVTRRDYGVKPEEVYWEEITPIPGTPRHYQRVAKAMEG